MATLLARRPAQVGHNSQGRASMYAIVFDLDTATLEQLYHNKSWRNAYVDVANCLGRHGFSRKQGSTYFGDESVNAVSCLLAVQDLTRTYDWFEPAVSDIRMLRIEETNDLMPAIASVGARGR